MCKLLFHHKEKAASIPGHPNTKCMLGYDGKDKTFSFDQSDLSCLYEELRFRAPGYIEITSEHTGVTKTFHLHKTHIEPREGELLYREYITRDGFKLLMFND